MMPLPSRFQVVKTAVLSSTSTVTSVVGPLSTEKVITLTEHLSVLVPRMTDCLPSGCSMMVAHLKILLLNNPLNVPQPFTNMVTSKAGVLILKQDNMTYRICKQLVPIMMTLHPLRFAVVTTAVPSSMNMVASKVGPLSTDKVIILTMTLLLPVPKTIDSLLS